MSAVTTSPTKKRFRLLSGRHSEFKVTGKDREDKDVVEPIFYNPGDIVESELDLCKEFNRYAFDGVTPLTPPKFANLDDPAHANLSPTANIWDPSTGETLEQFVERMKAAAKGEPPGSTGQSQPARQKAK